MKWWRLLTFLYIIVRCSSSVTITRHHLGDIFTTPECGDAACVGLSSGTATPAEKCTCRCLHHLPVFRDDLQICVEDIHECPLAPFMSGTTFQKIPYVFLPLKGQIVYPSAEIYFSGTKSPICVVSGAKFLTRSGWIDLRNRSDTEPPFRLFRDEGRTFLQWLGPPDLRISMEGRLLLVSLMCKDMADISAHSSIFTPCVAFRVAGTPSVREVSFSADAHATDHSSSNSSLSASEYVAIAICSILLGLMYIASVLLYLHTRRQHTKNHADHRADDLQTSGQLVEEGVIKNNPLLRHCHDNSGYITDSGPPSCCSDTEEGCSDDNLHELSDDNSICKPTQKITAAQIHPHHVQEIYTSDCTSMQLQDSSAIERLPEENVSIVETLEGREDRPETVRAITTASTRRKLYFNPAYFEPELLLAPPPAALEFLSKIREVIAIAKHKMAAKKFFPSLLGIPEETDNQNQILQSHSRHSHQGSVRSSIKTNKSDRERHRFLSQTPVISCDGCPGCGFQPTLEPFVEKDFKACCNTATESKQRSIRKWLEDVPLAKPQINNEEQPEKILVPPRRKGKAPSIPKVELPSKLIKMEQKNFDPHEISILTNKNEEIRKPENNILSTFSTFPSPSIQLDKLNKNISTSRDESIIKSLSSLKNTIETFNSNKFSDNNNNKELQVNKTDTEIPNEDTKSNLDAPDENRLRSQNSFRSSNSSNNNRKRENKIKVPTTPPPPPPPPPLTSASVETNDVDTLPPSALKNPANNSTPDSVVPKVAKKLMDAVIKEFVGQRSSQDPIPSSSSSTSTKPNPPLRIDSLNASEDYNTSIPSNKPHINPEYDVDSLERTLKEQRDKNNEGISTPSDYGEVTPKSSNNPNITLPLDEELTIQNAIFNTKTGHTTISKLHKTKSSRSNESDEDCSNKNSNTGNNTNSNSNTTDVLSKNKPQIEDDHEYEIILLNPETEKEHHNNNTKLALPDILNRGEGYSLVSEVYVNDSFSYGSSSLPSSNMSSSSSCSSSSRNEPKISYEGEKPGRLTIQVESPTYQQEDSDSFEPDTLDRKPSKLKISETNCHHLSDIDIHQNEFFVDSLERPPQISLKTTGSFRSESAAWPDSDFPSIFHASPLNRTFGSLREIFEARNKYNNHHCNRSEGFSPVGSMHSLNSDTDCYSTLSWKHGQPKILRPEARQARRQRQPSPDALPPRPPKLKQSREYRNVTLKSRIDSPSPPLPPRTIKPPLPPKNGSVRSISQRSGPACRPLPTLPPHSRSLSRRAMTNASGSSPTSSEYEAICNTPYYPQLTEVARTMRERTISNHRHIILRSTNRTEDSGYLSTDSNGSDGQMKREESLSETDDSLCDGASESGGESIATDSFFFGNNISRLSLANSADSGVGAPSTHSDSDSNVSFITVLPNGFNKCNGIIAVP